MSCIYLDANSTTPLDPEVQQVMLDCQTQNFANPASQHQPGQLARRTLEQIRTSIVDSLGGSIHDRLIFTSGGTESDNLGLIGLALGSLVERPRLDCQPNVVISSIEHPAVLGAANYLESCGFEIRRLGVDQGGCCRVDELPNLLDDETRVASMMLVNNETGVIQPVKLAATICQKHGVPLHCDAVQGVGKVEVNFADLGVSALTLTAHKIHGPRSIGGLLIAKNIDLQPMMFGGFQQLGTRPGTEDIVLAAGFGKAVELVTKDLRKRATYLNALRTRFEALLTGALPDCVINGHSATRAPHTSNMCFPGGNESTTVNRQALLMAVDMAGVAISTGSACASGSSEPSPVLTAMNCPAEFVESSIRVSFGTQNSEAEVVQASERIINAVKHLRRSKSDRK